jgi:hypothetical protein
MQEASARRCSQGRDPSPTRRGGPPCSVQARFLQNPWMARSCTIRTFPTQKKPFVFNGQQFGFANFSKFVLGDYIVGTTYPKM